MEHPLSTEQRTAQRPDSMERDRESAARIMWSLWTRWQGTRSGQRRIFSGQSTEGVLDQAAMPDRDGDHSSAGLPIVGRNGRSTWFHGPTQRRPHAPLAPLACHSLQVRAALTGYDRRVASRRQRARPSASGPPQKPARRRAKAGGENAGRARAPKCRRRETPYRTVASIRPEEHPDTKAEGGKRACGIPRTRIARTRKWPGGKRASGGAQRAPSRTVRGAGEVRTANAPAPSRPSPRSRHARHPAPARHRSAAAPDERAVRDGTDAAPYARARSPLPPPGPSGAARPQAGVSSRVGQRRS